MLPAPAWEVVCLGTSMLKLVSVFCNLLSHCSSGLVWMLFSGVHGANGSPAWLAPGPCHFSS